MKSATGATKVKLTKQLKKAKKKLAKAKKVRKAANANVKDLTAKVAAAKAKLC